MDRKKLKKQKQTIRRLAVVLIIVNILAMYLLQPVPQCKQIIEKNLSPPETTNATYTNIELENLKIEITNVTLIFRTRGYSMVPVIKDNSECACIKKDKYEVGDIVIFFMQVENIWQGISHQIVKIEGKNITTKGTNNNFLDPVITQENILCYIPKEPRYKSLFQK